MKDIIIKYQFEENGHEFKDEIKLSALEEYVDNYEDVEDSPSKHEIKALINKIVEQDEEIKRLKGVILSAMTKDNQLSGQYNFQEDYINS